MPKPKNKGSKPGKVEAAEPPPAPPSWPAFKPPLPIVDLTPVPHPLTSKVVLIPSFFPRSLCRDYVSFLKTLPLQTTPGRPKRGDAVRVNDRFQVNSQDFATRLWEQTGLKEVLLNSDYEQWWVCLVLISPPVRTVYAVWIVAETDYQIVNSYRRGGEPVGLSYNIRIYRYSKGQFFDCHCTCITFPWHGCAATCVLYQTTHFHSFCT
jgi:hypothetical protein